MLISSSVDHGFDPQGVRPNTIKFGIYTVSPSTSLVVRAKAGWVKSQANESKIE